MATFIFTHSDLDGLGCAILLKIIQKSCNGEEDIHVEYHTYESIDSSIQNIISSENHKSDTLYIADICPREETCELINNNIDKFSKVQLFDHHRTRSWVQKYPWATYSEEDCGTSLIQHSLIPVDFNDNFVRAVKAWDLWELKSPERARGEGLNSLVGFLGLEKFVNIFSKDLDSDLVDPLSFVIATINERKQRYVNYILKDQLVQARVYPDGFMNKFVILFATDFISEIGNAALLHPDYEDVNYVCVINPVSNTCSLRSRQGDELDVGNIAKLVHGGGHKNAAGFPVKMTQMIANHVFKILNSLNY